MMSNDHDYGHFPTSRVGRNDDSQYTNRQDHDYTRNREPVGRDQLSPRAAQFRPREVAYSPQDDQDQDEEEDSDEEIANLTRLLKLKTAKKARKVTNSDRSRRNNDNINEHRGEQQFRRGPSEDSPPSIERARRGAPEQDYYVPPSGRVNREESGSVRSPTNARDLGNGRPSRDCFPERLDHASSRDSAIAPQQFQQQSHPRDESYKFYQGQRLSSNVFSPGYGFRPPVPGNDTLPPPAELVGPHGTVHRIYPAPGPICAPLNANEGWIDHEAPTVTHQRGQSPPFSEVSANYRQQQVRPMSPPQSDFVPTPSTEVSEDKWNSPVSDRDQAPHLADQVRKPKQGAMVPWSPVEYSQDSSRHNFDGSSPSSPSAPVGQSASSQGPAVPWTGGVVYKQENLNEEGPAMTRDELLACFKRDDAASSMRGGYGGGGGGDRGGFNPPRQDSGYNQAPPQGNRQAWGDRGGRQKEDDGFGGLGQANGDEWGDSPGENASGDKNESSWGKGEDKENDSWGNSGASNGYGGDGYGGGGGGGGDGCRKCGENGHYARECPNGTADKCYNCGETGHMSRECTQERRGGGGSSGSCYNCGQEGHISRDCPEPRRSGGGGGGGGNCFNCEQPGHQSRDCPEPRKPGPFRGNCNTCGEAGHRASECQSSGSQKGYGTSGGYNDNRSTSGGNWGNSGQQDNGNNDSWGSTNKARSNHGNSNDNQWDSPAPDAAPPSRAAPAIHPDRAAQVDTRPFNDFNRAPPPHQGYEGPPADGKARDGGWGGMRGARSSTPAASVRRDPTPVPEDDENGGW